MWIRNDSNKIEEIRISRNKKRFTKSLNFGLYSFLGSFILMSIGSVTVGIGDRSNMAPPERISITELPDFMGEFLLISCVLAIVLFLASYFMILNEKKSICEKCFKIHNGKKVVICNCGGTFLPLEHFEWIEDKKE
jgi:hypothetical protein